MTFFLHTIGYKNNGLKIMYITLEITNNKNSQQKGFEFFLLICGAHGGFR
jgi:hypothetical protein